MSQILSHCKIHCLSGSPAVSLSAYLQREGTNIPNLYQPDARVSYTGLPGSSKLLKLNLDLTQLDFAYEAPYCKVWIEMNFTCSFESTIIIESFDISTKTSNHLAKAIIDFQDYYGNSIFANPEEGSLISYYINTFFEEVIGESQFFSFYPRKANETFLLLPGDYDIKSWHILYSRLWNITFNSDETTYLIIRCNVARTNIVVEPAVPVIYANVFSYASGYMSIPNSAHYYLPKGYEITILPWDSYSFQYSAARFAHTELSDPSIVSANLTYDFEPIPIIGSAIGIPRLVVYAFYVLLVLVIFLPRLRKGNRSEIFSKIQTPAEFSTILLLVSVLLPWMSFRLGRSRTFLVWFTLPLYYYSDDRGLGTFSTESVGSLFGQSLTFSLIGICYLLIYGFMIYRLLGDYKWANSKQYVILLGVLSAISLISVFFPFMPYQSLAIGGVFPLFAFILAMYSQTRSTVTPK